MRWTQNAQSVEATQDVQPSQRILLQSFTNLVSLLSRLESESTQVCYVAKAGKKARVAEARLGKAMPLTDSLFGPGIKKVNAWHCLRIKNNVADRYL